MKKIKYILGMILCIVLLVSCGEKSNQQSKGADSSEFNIKLAMNVVENYMKYLEKGDIENCKKLYSKKLLKNNDFTQDSAVMVKGYLIEEANEMGKSGLFKVKVNRVKLNNPYTSLDECSIKVVKEENDYKIDEVKTKIDREAFTDNGQIRIRMKEDVKTNLVLDFDGVPNYAFSKNDKSNVNKINVPKKNFGTMSFSYDGEKLAFSTYDNNTFASIITIEDTKQVQGGGEEGQQPQGGEKGGGKATPKETPIGKNLVSLDLLKDSQIDFMVYSKDAKYVLIQYSKNNVGKCIRIYMTDSGALIPFNIEENYPVDKVDVLFSSFDKEVLNFEVVPKGSTDKDAAQYTGKWQMDLKSFKVKKM